VLVKLGVGPSIVELLGEILVVVALCGAVVVGARLNGRPSR
jgi:hypothetical protein